MQPGRGLTYYRNATPWIVLLGGSLISVFIAVIVLLIEHPLQQSDMIMAWGTISFFGLGVVVFANGLLSDRRAPLLQITSEGVACPYSRFPLPTVGWADIGSLIIYEWTPKRASSRTYYYLAVIVRSPGGLRDPEEDDSVEWPMAPLLPDEEDRVAMLAPLDDLFFNNARPGQIRARTLDRIKTVFAPEIARYGVVIEESIRAV